MAWEENLRICLHMQLIAILSRTEVSFPNNNQDYFLGNATRGGSSETNGPASPCMGWWMEIAFN